MSTKVLWIRNLNFRQFSRLCRVFAKIASTVYAIDSKPIYMNSSCFFVFFKKRLSRMGVGGHPPAGVNLG